MCDTTVMIHARHYVNANASSLVVQLVEVSVELLSFAVPGPPLCDHFEDYNIAKAAVPNNIHLYIYTYTDVHPNIITPSV